MHSTCLSQLELSTTTKITKLKNGNLEEFNISYDEFECGDVLGSGHFGTVQKMHHPSSNLTFAVKVIKRLTKCLKIYFS